MSAGAPKQYLLLDDQPMLIHTVGALLAEKRLASVHIVLAPDDDDFIASGCESRLQHHVARVQVLRCGGATRAESVRNGLRAMAGPVAGRDWVLVHDAARPCLPRDALARLIDSLIADPVGGLLALPVADTLKRSDPQQRVLETASREGLWSAQTPQMFRHAALLAALHAAGPSVTDEAQAIEASGAQPRLVRGDPRNLKVTWPEDVALAECFLQHFRDRP
jgi:2-C-methyl-D-erythritol 4-phosphate cytidylyltransferase